MRAARPVRIGPRSAGIGAVALSLLAGVLSPTGAAAQVEDPERGWLGVALRDAVACIEPEPGRLRCDRTATVSDVVAGSPAARAGVRAGDTLVALDGERIVRGARDPAFARLRSGREIRLELRREGERITLSAVPRPRPEELARPSPPEGWSRLRTVITGWPPEVGDSGTVTGERRWVTIRLDSDSIRILPFDVDISGSDGVLTRVPVRLPSGFEAVEGDAADFEVVQVGPDVWGRLEFGPRLRALQDSVFRRARIHFDSIQARVRRAQGELRAREIRERAGSASPGVLVGTLFERRIAGAEFAPLNPELAEAVDGPDRGLLVLRVLPGTPAAELGLRPGDVVVEAAGRGCRELSDLRAALTGADGSGGVVVKWVRKGELLSATFRDD